MFDLQWQDPRVTPWPWTSRIFEWDDGGLIIHVTGIGDAIAKRLPLRNTLHLLTIPTLCTGGYEFAFADQIDKPW